MCKKCRNLGTTRLRGHFVIAARSMQACPSPHGWQQPHVQLNTNGATQTGSLTEIEQVASASSHAPKFVPHPQLRSRWVQGNCVATFRHSPASPKGEATKKTARLGSCCWLLHLSVCSEQYNAQMRNISLHHRTFSHKAKRKSGQNLLCAISHKVAPQT